MPGDFIPAGPYVPEGGGGGGGGVSSHADLTNKNSPTGQHSVAAVAGLQDALDALPWEAANSGLHAGTITEIVSAADRFGAGLDIWPDGPYGYSSDGTNEYLWASNGGTTARTTIVGDSIIEDPVLGITMGGHSIPYCAFGPVLELPSGRMMCLYYSEEHGDPAGYYSRLGMGYSDNPHSATPTWTDAGYIITPNLAFGDHVASLSLGCGTFMVIGDYFYVYHRDELASSPGRPLSLCVSRCLLADVESAIDDGDAPIFKKWNGSNWSQNGIGGISIDLAPQLGFSPAEMLTATYVEDLGAGVVVVSLYRSSQYHTFTTYDGVTFLDTGVVFTNTPAAKVLNPSIRPITTGDTIEMFRTRSVIGIFTEGGVLWDDVAVDRVELHPGSTHNTANEALTASIVWDPAHTMPDPYSPPGTFYIMGFGGVPQAAMAGQNMLIPLGTYMGIWQIPASGDLIPVVPLPIPGSMIRVIFDTSKFGNPVARSGAGMWAVLFNPTNNNWEAQWAGDQAVIAHNADVGAHGGVHGDVFKTSGPPTITAEAVTDAYLGTATWSTDSSMRFTMQGAGAVTDSQKLVTVEFAEPFPYPPAVVLQAAAYDSFDEYVADVHLAVLVNDDGSGFEVWTGDDGIPGLHAFVTVYAICLGGADNS